MFLKSLQWRLVTFFCIIAVSLVIPIGLFLTKGVEDTYYKSFVDSVKKFIEDWTPPEGPRKAEDVYIHLRDTRGSEFYTMIGDNRGFTVIDARNNDFCSSELNDPGKSQSFLNELQDSSNFIRALEGGTGEKEKLLRLQSSGREYFDYAERKGDYVLYFRYYSELWKPTVRSINGILVSSLFLAVIVAFILGYMLSKTITVPVNRVMLKAQAIASGDFDEVLDVKSDDEIGKLTSTFNYMAQNLKNTLMEISSQKNKMETILNYMTDGVIAFNLEGRMIHANPASKKILGRERMEDTFGQFVQKYQLNVTIEGISYLENIGSREITVAENGKTIRIYFAVFSGESRKPEGIIAVLQDVTEQRRLDDMRKEFVANVSHELRTPLTSIKSYTETLLDGILEDRETAEKFLKVINSEADRMTRIVKDLLELSRLDNSQMQLRLEDVSIPELVKTSVDKMTLEARNKKQHLECYVMGEIPLIKADYGRLEQVMMNILSNAIKYTQEGGRISVYVSRMYSEIYIKVSDTGIGIPEKDLPRIFERFYRVDKARSREMGGTGLGLSIAKEITEAHGGTISIKSEERKGTEIMVRLPVKGNL